MKNNKGFTMMELLAVFIILSLLVGISVISYQFIMEKVEANYYKTLEEELLLAGSDYYNNHREEKPIIGYGMVLIDELVGDKYIETLKDRSGKTCSPNNDSKVYIYRTENGYDYEACLVCNDHETTGAYCDGNILDEIIISAKKENSNAEYNVLKMSYNSTGWSNENISVTFKINDKNVTKYVITNVSDNSEKICDSITNKSCSMTFTSSGSYTVIAYDSETIVGGKKAFYVKIDKEKPVCEFVSGPSVALINNSLTSTYKLECTDNNLDNASITTNNFSQTNSSVVLIQNISLNDINNGYEYLVKVIGNLDGETALKLNALVVKDKAGNGNVSVLSNSIKVDVTKPNISYSLPSDTYNENKTITITVGDNGGVNQIKYNIYKDEVLVSSDTLTGNLETTVSFDVDLNSDGTWKIDVLATDEVGNEGTGLRDYIIATVQNCWYELDHYFDTAVCGASGSVGDEQYITCARLYGYNVMFKPNSVSGPSGAIGWQSCYTSSAVYSSETNALNYCEQNYISHCYSRYNETNEYGKVYYLKCFSYAGDYRNYVYKRVCE